MFGGVVVVVVVVVSAWTEPRGERSEDTANNQRVTYRVFRLHKESFPLNPFDEAWFFDASQLRRIMSIALMIPHQEEITSEAMHSSVREAGSGEKQK
jgi:hypothetical protein